MADDRRRQIAKMIEFFNVLTTVDATLTQAVRLANQAIRPHTADNPTFALDRSMSTRHHVRLLKSATNEWLQAAKTNKPQRAFKTMNSGPFFQLQFPSQDQQPNSKKSLPNTSGEHSSTSKPTFRDRFGRERWQSGSDKQNVVNEEFTMKLDHLAREQTEIPKHERIVDCLLCNGEGHLADHCPHMWDGSNAYHSTKDESWKCSKCREVHAELKRRRDVWRDKLSEDEPDSQ